MLFNCYRHLIQKFGSSSMCGKLVARLLFIPTKELFLEYWNKNRQMIIEILNSSTVTNRQKFTQLFQTTFDGTTLSDPLFDFQGIWTRAEFGVSTCSNHIESIHSKLNKRVLNIRKFDSRLREVLNYLIERRKSALSRPNLRNAINAAKKKIKYDTHHEKCQFDPILQFKNKLYGEFPCIHEINRFTISSFQDFTPEHVPIDFDSNSTTLTNTSWVFQTENNKFELDPADTEFLSKNPIDMSKFKRILSNIPRKQQFSEEFIMNIFIHFTRKFTIVYNYNSPIFAEFAVLMQTKTLEEAEQIAECRFKSQTQKFETDDELEETEKAQLDIVRDNLFTELIEMGADDIISNIN